MERYAILKDYPHLVAALMNERYSHGWKVLSFIAVDDQVAVLMERDVANENPTTDYRNVVNLSPWAGRG